MQTIFKMAALYLHFLVVFQVNYLSYKKLFVNKIIKNWNMVPRPNIQNNFIFTPEFPFNKIICFVSLN